MVVEFREDDEGYLDWVRQNPEGFVINSGPQPGNAVRILHRADCGTITGKPAKGGRWTYQYKKVCWPDRAGIDRWAQRTEGGSLRLCGVCGL